MSLLQFISTITSSVLCLIQVLKFSWLDKSVIPMSELVMEKDVTILEIPTFKHIANLNTMFLSISIKINCQILNFFKNITKDPDRVISLKYSEGYLVVRSVGKSELVITIKAKVRLLINCKS
eukprot:TRINITY_DN3813_c0_g2_i14.p2 TRINITY_DN3813_c0_g2~~TRINITY_DN3813_c0_g2_i14.p2  ORF type:complete len:122 (+),score=3.76 TRINITY_DN3813_c0_g2_i14:391-756(+)